MKRFSVLLAFLVFAGAALFGQGQQITGTVTSEEDGSPLPGVTVLVRGTSIGTVTDFEGNYSIVVPEGSNVLVFSFVGMENKEVEIGAATSIDVAMRADAVRMDEVVVIGYGTSTREANTGSVAVVGDEDLQDIPELSFDKMLTGKVAGVQVTGTSGQPGAATQVRIRGTSSLNAGNEPLYVVDGVPVMQGDQTYFTNTGNALAMINPSDIESISILKDAAAASVYGSRAANGVIIITTKSGTAGKSKVNFRASYGVTSLANDNDYGQLNPEQLIDYMRDAVVNAGKDPDDPTNGSYYVPNSLADGPQTNWFKEVTRLGSVNEYQLSVNGGNEKTKHFTSALYSSTEGVFKGVDYTKYQLRSNIDHSISDRLRMGVKLNAFHSFANDMAMQALYYVNPVFGSMIINPWTPAFNEDGTVNMEIPENLNTNPVATALYDDQWESQNRLQGSAYVEWEPVAGLKLKSTNAVEYTDGEGRRYWSPEADFAGNATLQVSRTKYSQITSSNTASYSKYFNDHNVNLLAGFEAIDNSNNSYYIYSPNVDGKIPFPNTSTAEADEGSYGESRYTLASFFGILDYNFASKYFIRASLRTDGSSRFGINNRWATFYSVGASWNIHKEAFLENISAINIVKLRASYGVNGNDRIGNYEQWGIYGPVGYNATSGMAPSQPANNDLTWETNTSYNFGLDFGFLRRITGTVDFYNRVTTDMLLDTPLSRTTGFTSLRQNIGSLKNTGIEGLLNVAVVQGTFNWNLGFNFAANRSEILDLGTEEQIISGRQIYQVGEKLYSYYLRDYAGVNPVNGHALWYNEYGELTELYANARRVIAGTPESKLLGGINTDISWKGFALNVNLEYKYGTQVLIEEQRYLNSDGYMWGNNQANTILDYWKEPGDITRNPIPIAGNTTSSNGYYSSRWMFAGDYLRIKNVTISYTLPANMVSRINVERLRIYGSAVNAYTFHDVDFWDPERGVNGQGFGIYPMAKSFVVGLDLTF
ncbi:MAG: TonB-dependent receptor [Bacteroidales bacterium]|nr:TonB-dependent receptor [Bacteroidales bacterium]